MNVHHFEVIEVRQIPIEECDVQLIQALLQKYDNNKHNWHSIRSPKIDLIKWLRVRYALSLKQAKDIIDKIDQEQQESIPSLGALLRAKMLQD